MKKMFQVFLFLIFFSSFAAAQQNQNSVKLKLPLLFAHQAVKSDTINSALLRLDGMVQASSIAVATNILAASASEGDTYIISATRTPVFLGFSNLINNPTGEFQNQESKVAYLLNGDWIFFQPRDGWLVHNQEDNTFYTYIAANNSWFRFMTVGVLGSLSLTAGANIADVSGNNMINFTAAVNGGKVQINNATGNESMLLDGQKQVFLPPRIPQSTEDGITNVTGAIIFNNETGEWKGYTGSAWVKFATAP